MFWGLWLFPVGALVYRSGFLPRFIGIWLLGNGAAYRCLSATLLLAPHVYDAAFRYATPLLLGEAVLMLWLLIRGVRPEPAPA